MARERKSAAKTAANRSNAARSTGPRTRAGKAAAKMNAVAHGLRAAVAVLPGERAEEWEAYRAGVAAALAPVGTLEAELADRVALVTWRLRRVVRHETAATTAAQDAAARRAARGEPDEPSDAFPGRPTVRSGGDRRTPDTVRQELAAARELAADHAVNRDLYRRLQTAPAESPLDGREACRLLREAFHYTPQFAATIRDDDDGEYDDDFHELTAIEDRQRQYLTAAKVPQEWRGEPEWWGGWTAGAVVAGVAAVAAASALTAEALIQRAVREAGRRAEAEGQRAEALGTELARVEAEAARAEAAARARTVLPSVQVLDSVARYESHLGRQLRACESLAPRALYWQTYPLNSSDARG